MMPAAVVTQRRPRRKAVRDYSAIATQFEEDVLSGRFPACVLFRAAVEKQRREVANPPPGYVFSAEAGDKVCRRAERFPFHEGPRRGKPFELGAWQVWLFRTLFGWVDPVTGWRRFRDASLWMPKGQGKSPIAALIALCILTVATGGDKGYSAASAQHQARHVFDAAKEMLRIDADNAAAEGRKAIRDHFGLVVEEHQIKGANDNRAYRPVSAEAGTIEGVRPFFLVLDEVHVLPNRKLYDNLQSASNKVDGSLFVTISTAGFDMSPDSLAWSLYKRARQIILGEVDEPTTFALIIEADRTKPDGTPADPLDFATWEQANPNLGVSVSIAGLQKAMRTWRDTPSERPSIEVKHLGWWQQNATSFIQPALWAPLADMSMRVEDLGPEWSIFAGVDLARTRDLSAAVICAARTNAEGRREYRVFSRLAYVASESVTVKLIPEIAAWSKDRWITLTPGPSTSYARVKADIAEALKPFPSAEVCFDDWCAAEMEEDLQSRGLTCVSIRQGAKTQSEPMKELEAAVLDGRLRHDGSPVMAMCIGNLQAKSDENGNIRPTRENEYKKIDLAVALINAMARASIAEFAPDLSGGFQWI
jgi:phage terminase large subunit-like protein